MKKRIISFLLGLILILSLALPVMAENRNGVYILDEKEYLTQAEYQFLQIQAAELSDELGMDLLYVLTYETDLEAGSQNLNLGNRDDQIMLIGNDNESKILLFGAANALTEEDVAKLEEAYTLAPTYIDGVTAYLAAADDLVSERNANGAFDAYLESSSQNAEGSFTRLEDMAGLLNYSQQLSLRQQLDEISQRQQLDVVVVTTDSLDGKSAMEYADDFFDYNGYGIGANRDGILLLVSMEERDWWISTSGFGITAFTDKGLEYISDRVVPQLSDGDYEEAFRIFAEQCDAFVTQARTGEPYDVGSLPKEPFRFGKCLFVSLVIGFIAAGIVVLVLKGQLKSVRSQSGAANYSKSGSPKLTVNKETYLYSTMSSRPKPKPSESSHSSGGGSSTHRSSSGRSHGGRGGKF